MGLLTKKRYRTREPLAGGDPAPAGGERTPGQLAADENFDRMFKASLRGEDLYPNGSAFVAADVPWTLQSIEQYRHEGVPVVLCFPEGETYVIKPPLRRALVHRFLMLWARHAHRGPYAVLYPR